jgi:hypothetical protein
MRKLLLSKVELLLLLLSVAVFAAGVLLRLESAELSLSKWQ